MCELLRLFALGQGAGAKASVRHSASTALKHIFLKRRQWVNLM